MIVFINRLPLRTILYITTNILNFYIANTDHQWYNYLKSFSPEDINFWQPGGNVSFKAVSPGSPFLFRLKSPVNKIAGLAFFSTHSILPLDFAWEVFGYRNGVGSLKDFITKISSYRRKENSFSENPNIGCIVLTNPIFFNESDWISPPADWRINIVQGKTYGTSSEIGRRYWGKIQDLLKSYRLFEAEKEIKSQLILEGLPEKRYGSEILTKVRLGQGAFRVMLTDAYSRKCAISGERTLPVLEAAHIKPYAESGPHFISNGLLLRSDMHKLFDSGYLTITQDYRVEVSKRIREEFENGREYYKFHGNQLLTLPKRNIDLPDPSFIQYHNNQIFKG